MRAAFVTPRYGRQVVGGAESAIRYLATHLGARPDWDVEVLTTCAADSNTWANDVPAGITVEDGVPVHRFASASGRDAGFDRLSSRVLANPRRTSMSDAMHWVDLQGPRNPALIDAVAASTADVVVFSPYLFHPTVHGVPAAAGRAVLHPAAHDEPPFRLPVYRNVFRQARAIVYYTESERRLAEERFRVAASPHLVLGLGIEDDGDAAGDIAELGIGDAPFVVCIGRVDPSKGTSMLGEFFARYKQRRPGPLKLVLLGQVVEPPDPHPDIVLAGIVSEAVKWAALRAASVYVTPSGFESFSLVMLEAWTAGTPVMANARCGATREHCERSGGGLWFGDYPHFEVALDRLLGDGHLREELVANGRAYVDHNFRWPVLTERYATFLQSLPPPVVSRR